MVLNFNLQLQEVLADLKNYTYHEFLIKSKDKGLDMEVFLANYGSAKWKIMELINDYYGTNFDHYNWLHYAEEDEVAYFLNEACSNGINYSELQKFQLWIGKDKLVIGIEQSSPFPALEVEEKKIKTNQGAAFDFFRRCKGQVFFDNPNKARIVFLKLKVRKLEEQK